MVEHRLIERMIALIEEALADIAAAGRVDPLFVDAAVDFIRTYADRTHHGKEEDILFRELAGKKLSEADRRLMDELIAEHALGRAETRALAEANARYRRGEVEAQAVIAEKLGSLAGFYPGHIRKEDKIFFPAARAYFTEEEDQAMLEKFLEFDRRMIHEKYRTVVEEFGG